MKTVTLFDETASTDPKDEFIINGATTGISNLNSTKYEWTKPLYRTMVGNFWIPERVNMSEDRVTIKNLNDDEDDAVKSTISFLIFLDSFQGNNLPNIRKYITSPSISNLIAIQEFQEIIHQQSYQYILDALYPSFTREEIYNRWRNDPILLKRNKFIANIAEKFLENPSHENFLSIVAANYALEGIYFYSGFNLFDQLAHRGKLVQTSTMIDYIRNDEMTHMGLFIHIVRELFDFKNRTHVDMIYAVVEEACNQEIEWCHHRYGNRILGISTKSSTDHVHWLGNDRLKRLGLDPIFPKVENPYKHLIDASKGAEKRGNFFEAAAVIEYTRSETVQGWDDF